MDDKTSNGRNYLTRGETIVNGVLIPDVSGVYDIGSPTQRFKTVYADIEGNVSDPDISVNFIRFPYIGPNDLRMYRSSAKVLEVDDNASGDATLNVATLGKVKTFSSAVIEPQIRPLAGWGRTRFSNGATTGNVALETGTSLPGFTALSFNGYSDSGSEFRYNTGKRRWRIMSYQNSTADYLNIDSYDGTTTRSHFTIDPSLSERVTLAQGLNTSTIGTTSGDLTISPAGTNVNLNGKSLINATVVNLGNSLSVQGSPKVRLYDDGSLRYGFGVQGGVLSYEVPTGSSKHSFLVNGIERANISDTAAQFSVPITTVSGDLSLNPAGSNINCNNKTLTNVTISSGDSGNITLTSTNWSGSLTLRIFRNGSIYSARLTGTVTATAINGIFSSVGTPIPAGYRPAANSYAQAFNIAVASGFINILVYTTGVIEMAKIAPSGNWAISDQIQFTNQVFNYTV